MVRDFVKDVAFLVCEMLLRDEELRLDTTMLMKNWKDEYTRFATPLPGSNTGSKNPLILYYSRPVLFRGSDILVKGTAMINCFKR